MQDEENIGVVSYLTNDILESLPALCDLKDTANTLTTSVYTTWRSIKVSFTFDDIFF